MQQSKIKSIGLMLGFFRVLIGAEKPDQGAIHEKMAPVLRFYRRGKA